MKKNFKKQIKLTSELRVIKKKDDKLHVKWKGYQISLIAGQRKKILLYKMSYLPEPYSPSKSKIKVEVDLSNYAIKSDFKGATGIDTSKFAKEIDLVILKSDVDKLETTVDLSELSNVVNNNVVKKTIYIMNWLKKLMEVRLLVTKKLTTTQKLEVLKRKFLIMINTLQLNIF